MTTNAQAEELTLEELVAARSAIDARIEQQLKYLRDSDLANAHQAQREAIERRFPSEIENLLNVLRSCSIALVFHDGKLEGGPTGASLEENVRQAIASYARFGFSEQFKKVLAQAVLPNVREAPFSFYEHATLCERDALQLIYRAAVRIRQLCGENPFTGTRAQILALADGMHNLPLLLTGNANERRANHDRLASEIEMLRAALLHTQSSVAPQQTEREMPRFQLFSRLASRNNKPN
ncbi:hypothetical protein [Ralstonia solanacearum]|uniref:hypothetical protein n=1 Tax=Ralstonia solanacearum TaxID=305 RepID=UPI000698BAD1|nr:hypothetical protein [Ralstonia solanacearum]MDC6177119.1 hypothetical protein [Ralstonia solanacearum]MDC6238349.1 hypothetical protein [Ralstonia solanacearum]